MPKIRNRPELLALYCLLTFLCIGNHSAYSEVSSQASPDLQRNLPPVESVETAPPSSSPEVSPSTTDAIEPPSPATEPETRSRKMSKADARDLLYQWLGVSFLFIFFLVAIMVLLRNRNR